MIIVLIDSFAPSASKTQTEGQQDDAELSGADWFLRRSARSNSRSERRTRPSPTEQNENTIMHTETPVKNGSGGMLLKRSRVRAADPNACAVLTAISSPRLCRIK
jgi:hypothetical protein